MKYIREGRFGPPKAFKTGAVVGSYPKPMLVLNFDAGGLDVIQQPINYIEPSALKVESQKKKEDLPPITCVDLWDKGTLKLGSLFNVSGPTESFNAFIQCINTVVDSCPWATVVIDPLTTLVEKALFQLAATNTKAMDDPRKWASMVGSKVFQAAQVACTLKAHSVCIMHSAIEKDELTGMIGTYPIIPSKVRESIGKLFSQYFYACFEAGKPVVYTAPKGFVYGIGCRWPHNLKPVCSPTFQDIYGTLNE